MAHAGRLRERGRRVRARCAVRVDGGCPERLHRLDAASVELIRHQARRVTRTDARGPYLPPVADATGTGTPGRRAQGFGRAVRLTPFSPDEAQEPLGAGLDGATQVTLYRESGENPFSLRPSEGRRRFRFRRPIVRVGEQSHQHAVRPHGRRGHSQHAIQRTGRLSGACPERNAAYSRAAHFEAMRREYEVAALWTREACSRPVLVHGYELLDGRPAGRCPAPPHGRGTSRPSMAQMARICLPGRGGDPGFLRAAEGDVRHGKRVPFPPCAAVSGMSPNRCRNFGPRRRGQALLCPSLPDAGTAAIRAPDDPLVREPSARPAKEWPMSAKA